MNALLDAFSLAMNSSQADPSQEVEPVLDPEQELEQEGTGNDNTNNDENNSKVVVELGAGFYTNAIRNRTLHPGWILTATNKLNPDESRLIERFEQLGLIPPEDHGRYVTGFREAQARGIIVGDHPAHPLGNEMIPSNTADLVYVINPWPGTVDQGEGVIYGYGMGEDAGRIAKSVSGTEIYIATDSVDTLRDFERGLRDSGYICNWRDDTFDRFGSTFYGSITHAQTCKVPQ